MFLIKERRVLCVNEFEEKLLKILNLFKSKILCTENREILENFNKLEKNVHT